MSGMKAGIPIAMGYIPVAVTFGLLAKSSGMPDYASILMSLVVYAGASQFVGVNLWALGATPWEIILTTFILNLRMFLMSASLSQRLPAGTKGKWLALLSHGITDETFTVASLRQEWSLQPSFLSGLHVCAFSAWNLGTWIGLFFAAGLPHILQASMGIALYAMFIGLLLPAVRKSRSVALVALTAVLLQSVTHWVPAFTHMPSGWSMIMATIIASLLGAILFPEEERSR